MQIKTRIGVTLEAFELALQPGLNLGVDVVVVVEPEMVRGRARGRRALAAGEGGAIVGHERVVSPVERVGLSRRRGFGGGGRFAKTGAGAGRDGPRTGCGREDVFDVWARRARWPWTRCRTRWSPGGWWERCFGSTVVAVVIVVVVVKHGEVAHVDGRDGFIGAVGGEGRQRGGRTSKIEVEDFFDLVFVELGEGRGCGETGEGDDVRGVFLGDGVGTGRSRRDGEVGGEGEGGGGRVGEGEIAAERADRVAFVDGELEGGRETGDGAASGVGCGGGRAERGDGVL